MLPTSMLPLAAMTVMLWILWSDMIRPRRPSKLVYSMRVVLFAAVTGVMIYNRLEYPWQYARSASALTWLAAAVGACGIAYFVRKIVARA